MSDEANNPMKDFFLALIRDNPECKEAIVERFASGKAFGEDGSVQAKPKETFKPIDTHEIYEIETDSSL